MFIDDSPSFKSALLDDFIPPAFSLAFINHLDASEPSPWLSRCFYFTENLFHSYLSLLILFLNLCRELRSFCGFTKIPDAPLFTRFKLSFQPYIELMFQQMVDYTEPICQAIDHSLADMLIFDTSGIELYVNGNNPKTLNLLIRKLKTYYKNNPNIDPYKMAYGLMPTQAASCPDAKQ